MEILKIILVVLSAIVPAVVLIWYIRYLDKKQPEPMKKVLIGVLLGVCAALLSIFISTLLERLGFYSSNPVSIGGAVLNAFFGAAIPEELCKLFFLWLLLRKNKDFDQYMDGVVYSVSIGMGFAGFENILYLTDSFINGEFILVWVIRALFAVPGHFVDAVLMGCFYSLYRFSTDKDLKKVYVLHIILAPILIHGVYDSIAMSSEFLNSAMTCVLFVLLILFCICTWRFAQKRIAKIASLDNTKFLTSAS